MLCHPSGERWTVELRLDEHDGNQGCQHTVYLNRVFVTETAASRAGEQVIAEWAAGRIVVRDLMLQELAATYRRREEFSGGASGWMLSRILRPDFVSVLSALTAATSSRQALPLSGMTSVPISSHQMQLNR